MLIHITISSASNIHSISIFFRHFQRLQSVPSIKSHGRELVSTQSRPQALESSIIRDMFSSWDPLSPERFPYSIARSSIATHPSPTIYKCHYVTDFPFQHQSENQNFLRIVYKHILNYLLSYYLLIVLSLLHPSQ